MLWLVYFVTGLLLPCLPPCSTLWLHGPCWWSFLSIGPVWLCILCLLYFSVVITFDMAYTHTHIHTHTHTTHTQHTYIHTHVHTHTHTYTTRTHACVRTHTHIHIHTYTHTYTYMHTCTYPHTNTVIILKGSLHYQILWNLYCDLHVK